MLFFPVCPGTVPERLFVFSSGDEGIFLSFPNPMIFATAPGKLHLTNSQVSEGEKKEFNQSREIQRHKIYFTL